MARKVCAKVRGLTKQNGVNSYWCQTHLLLTGSLNQPTDRVLELYESIHTYMIQHIPYLSSNIVLVSCSHDARAFWTKAPTVLGTNHGWFFGLFASGRVKASSGMSEWCASWVLVWALMHEKSYNLGFGSSATGVNAGRAVSRDCDGAGSSSWQLLLLLVWIPCPTYFNTLTTTQRCISVGVSSLMAL